MSGKYLGDSVPKLGFGFMRLPKTVSGHVENDHIYVYMTISLKCFILSHSNSFLASSPSYW